VLSARHAQPHKVAALDAGADDYVTKPFGMDELLVRYPGRLVTQQALLHEVWGPTYRTETNYLRVYMSQLRRKLEIDPTPIHATSSPARVWDNASSPEPPHTSRNGCQTLSDWDDLATAGRSRGP
jgi:DNA-binding response OmpR family regulator